MPAPPRGSILGVVRALPRLAAVLALAAAAVSLVAACGGEEAAEQPVVAFDRAFIDAMVPHHEAAIEMAREAKRAGLEDPELVALADAVIATQQDEIDRMRAWRAEWYGTSEIHPESAEVLGLSAAEMGMQHDPARVARGDVDRSFAALMIDHHEGAVTMARLALERADAPEIRTLAEEIITAQEREIDVLREHAAHGH
jgi:uncharacterized protein (DUF305 family)